MSLDTSPVINPKITVFVEFQDASFFAVLISSTPLRKLTFRADTIDELYQLFWSYIDRNNYTVTYLKLTNPVTGHVYEDGVLHA